MSEEPPPVRCDDESTWRHKGEKIDLPRLLELIEKNGGPEGLDLHGCDMEDINARPWALRAYLETYAQKHGADARPPWLMVDPDNGISGISLHDAHLEHANLVDVHLENANLEHAHLENANLSDAHLQNASLSAAHLQNASLSDAHLQNASLLGTHLENAHLWDAHLENANLFWSHLENASLSDAHLQNASLSRAHLENADLSDAHLQNASLLGAHLENANLVGARLHAAFWYESYLDRTRIRRESLGQAIGDDLGAKGRASPPFQAVDFHHAREAYLALKTNFDSIGRYDDASWAYVKEQQMEKAMHFPTTPGHRWIRRTVRRGHRRWLKSKRGRLRRLVHGSILGRLHWAWLHLRLFLGLCPREVRQEMARRDEQGEERSEWLNRPRWLRNWAFELLAGYGERVHMPVIWAPVVITVFTAIYAGAGNIASGDGGGTHNFLTALTHSIGAFATIGFNTLEPVGWGARLLTAMEAMLGIGLFALFVFTLGNRMRRS